MDAENLKNPVQRIVSLPLKLSRIYGILPFYPASSTTEQDLILNWKSFLSSLSFILFVLFPAFGLLIISREEMSKVFYITYNTDWVIVYLITVIIHGLDCISLLLLLINRQRFQKFYKNFNDYISKLYRLSGRKALVEDKLGVMYFLIAISCLNLIIDFIVYMLRAYYTGLNFWKMGVVFGLIFQWITLYQFRLFALSFWISLILCFKLGFRCLADVVSLEEKSEEVFQFAISPKIKWMMESYQKMETFLEEYHQLFYVQLISLCVTTLLPAVNMSFILTTYLEDFNFGGFQAASVFSHLVPLFISVAIFFQFCDAATKMKREALVCIGNMRKIPIFSLKLIDRDVRDKITLLYIEKVSSPPKISVSKFFAVGRHVLPGVLGMLTTYFLFLYQLRHIETDT